MERFRSQNCASLVVILAVFALAGCNETPGEVPGKSAIGEKQEQQQQVEQKQKSKSPVKDVASNKQSSKVQAPVGFDAVSLILAKTENVERVLGKPTYITETGKFRDYRISGFELITAKFQNGKAVSFQGYLEKQWQQPSKALEYFQIDSSVLGTGDESMLGVRWSGKLQDKEFSEIRTSKMTQDEGFTEIYVRHVSAS
jgi:predicted small lipoprotein YifL